METISINQSQTDLIYIFENPLKEPVIVKNNMGNSYLVVPFSKENWQDIFLMLYQSFNEINRPLVESKSEVQKMTSKEYLAKWGGILSDSDVSNWKDDYYNHLLNKYK
jgi:hypothetical protein